VASRYYFLGSQPPLLSPGDLWDEVEFIFDSEIKKYYRKYMTLSYVHINAFCISHMPEHVHGKTDDTLLLSIFNNAFNNSDLTASNDKGNTDIIISPCQVDPCDRGMARPQVAHTEDGLQIRKVTVNKLNKYSRTADKGRSSHFGIGPGCNRSSP
jgi:hypothetical protein